MIGDETRTDLLRHLIDGSAAPREVMAALSGFPWDSDEELAVLYRSDVAQALQAFLDGQFTAGRIEEWADALEARDDIGLERGSEEVLRRVIFELSNPDIEGPLTSARAHEWLSVLSR